jgi:hypothetical protein
MIKGKVKFSLQQAMKAQRGSRGIAVLFLFNLDARCGGWLMPCPSHFTHGNNPVPIV